MKQAIHNTTAELLHKIEAIEQDVKSLKISLLKRLVPTGKKSSSFKGILKGIDITQKDISFAKRSLCSKIKI